ncbi:hypothetical protein BCY84_19504 [Trypanosoma cruzi cruzi]|nr:hypothetical protein BCY84_19504 [Trypanosoma cruzi cruzi]
MPFGVGDGGAVAVIPSYSSFAGRSEVNSDASAFVDPMIPSDDDVNGCNSLVYKEAVGEMNSGFRFPLISPRGDDKQNVIKRLKEGVEKISFDGVSNGPLVVGDACVTLKNFEQMLVAFRSDLVGVIRSEIEGIFFAPQNTEGGNHAALPKTTRDEMTSPGKKGGEVVGFSQALRAHLSNAFRKYY